MADCLHCGAEIVLSSGAGRPRTKFCSTRCRKAVGSRRVRARIAADNLQAAADELRGPATPWWFGGADREAAAATYEARARAVRP